MTNSATSVRTPEIRTRPNVTSPRDSGSRRALGARSLSVVSAALLLAGGYVHFCLYRHGYRFIPKIGTSFLLQAASSAVLAGALLLPPMWLRVGRHRVALAQVTRLSAVGLSLGTLAALGIAHTPGGLFQFREIGLRPAPQTLIAILVESLGAVLVTVALARGGSALRTAEVSDDARSPARRPFRNAA
jgi:hypothetical protein